jgi:hypothetical protein
MSTQDAGLEPRTRNIGFASVVSYIITGGQFAVPAMLTGRSAVAPTNIKNVA